MHRAFIFQTLSSPTQQNPCAFSVKKAAQTQVKTTACSFNFPKAKYGRNLRAFGGCCVFSWCGSYASSLLATLIAGGTPFLDGKSRGTTKNN
jgi:hypothetical protein